MSTSTTSTYDRVSATRARRLATLDSAVSRCPLCGAWRWRATCQTPHAPNVETVTTDG